jgi:hypothetical protein
MADFAMAAVEVLGVGLLQLERWLARIIRVKCDRGATLPERRQCSCALKRQAGQVIPEITCEKFKHRAERREYDETFPLVPSLAGFALWGRTSIDTV